MDVTDLKPFNCSTTLDYTLKALPPISKEYEAIAEKITMPFTGDGNFSAFNGEEEEEPAEEDPEAPKPPRFREEHRLSYNVKVMILRYLSQLPSHHFSLPTPLLLLLKCLVFPLTEN